MTRDNFQVNDGRMGWIVALLTIAGAAAMAFGFSTPGQRMTKVEARVDDHESRIKTLEDTKDTIEAIAKAVGAPIKRRPSQ